MNPLLLHTSRKALFTATLTMAGAIVLVLVYWVAAIHGVVPSPGRPLLAGYTATNCITNQMAFHPAAETPAKQTSPATRPESTASTGQANPAEGPDLTMGSSATARIKATAVSVSPVAIAPTNPPVVAVTNRPPEPFAETKDAPTNMLAAQPAGPVPLVLPEMTWQDEDIARRWATSTNERPVVRVLYARSDVLELLRAGRGILVASSGSEHEKKRREFCLATPPGANPEYVAFTANHAARFAKFGVAMRKEGELARLARPLPAYFGGEAESITLEFVPDAELGRDIYTQVSRAMRSANVPPTQQTGWIYEGELQVEAGRPEFVLQRVRTANREIVFAAKPGELPRSTN